MALLHLNLRGEYFDQIKSGKKKYEYRLANDYWKKRLAYKPIIGEPKRFDGILIKRGYPKRDDKEKIIFRPWRGVKVKRIKHKHFGDKPVNVFAIRVN